MAAVWFFQHKLSLCKMQCHINMDRLPPGGEFIGWNNPRTSHPVYQWIYYFIFWNSTVFAGNCSFSFTLFPRAVQRRGEMNTGPDLYCDAKTVIVKRDLSRRNNPLIKSKIISPANGRFAMTETACHFELWFISVRNLCNTLNQIFLLILTGWDLSKCHYFAQVCNR